MRGWAYCAIGWAMAAAMNRSFALGRLKKGTMNKTEVEYAKILDVRKFAGEIEWYAFEGITFRLAANTRYTPDFVVMLAGGAMECHEVKGYWMDDARAKIKIAADLFPFRFIALKKVKKEFVQEVFE